MAIQKNITIDGIDVPFKASAAVPRLYRLKFRRDIYQDLRHCKSLWGKIQRNPLHWILKVLRCLRTSLISCKHADAAIPASPDEWLEQFNTFSIYEILRS